MIKTNNKIIRDAMKKTGIPQWKVAELIGVSEYTLLRRLRKELPQEEQERIAKIIEEKGGKK